MDPMLGPLFARRDMGNRHDEVRKLMLAPTTIAPSGPPTYLWDADRELLRLESPDVFPRLPRTRRASPFARTAIEGELARRRGALSRLSDLEIRLARHLGAVGRELEASRGWLMSLKGFRFTNPAAYGREHVFQVNVVASLDRAEFFRLNADSLRTKVLAECLSRDPHCKLREGAVFEMDADELTLVMGSFERSFDEVTRLTAAVGDAGQMHESVGGQLAAVTAEVRSPVRIRADAVMRDAPGPRIPVPVAGIAGFISR